MLYNKSVNNPYHKSTLPTPGHRAVPWLRRLVAGLPPRRPGSDPGSVHAGFVVDEVAGFFPEYFGFPLSISFHRAPLLGNRQKIIIILHNKPQGCGASVASAAGPFTTKKNSWPPTHTHTHTHTQRRARTDLHGNHVCLNARLLANFTKKHQSTLTCSYLSNDRFKAAVVKPSLCHGHL
jgi:hypothetical protein